MRQTSLSRVTRSLVAPCVLLLAAACGGDDTTGVTPTTDGGGDGNTGDGAGGDSGNGDAGNDANVNPDAGDASLPPTIFSHYFNGPVRAMVHDGTSWYVGGNFYGANVAPAPRLLQLDAKGGVGTTCVLQSGFDGPVTAILQVASSVYVGGQFGLYQGKRANGLVRLDASTCALDTTFSPPNANGFDAGVDALATSGSSLYVGGSFNMYRGVANSAHRIAKLDLATGAIDTTFSPAGPANGFDNTVRALAVVGTSLFVGGDFTAYQLGGNKVANHLTKLDLTSGAVDTNYTGNASGFDQSVRALASSGTTLYVGGAFTAYKGVANSAVRLAKIDTTNGAIDTTFSPVGATANGFSGLGGNDQVDALLVNGSSLYVGGQFRAYKGVASSANSLAKLDLTTGAIDTTFSPVGPNANGVDNRVTALAVSGTSLIVGGQFAAYRGAAGLANNLAKVDLATGAQDTTFAPAGNTVNGFEQRVRALMVNGSAIWAGGSFVTYAGYAASSIAKLDDVTYALDTTFSPANGNGFDGGVNALLVANKALYAGGAFGRYRGVAGSASRLAKLDLVTGALDTTFSPNGANANGFDTDVTALATSGTSLYVGGVFTRYKNAANSANRLAKLDLTSGALDTTFSPPGQTANGFNVDVLALATSSTSLYVGGDFNQYRGAANSAIRLAKLDLTSGALDTTFSPPGQNANGFDAVVEALALDGTSLYVGGAFNNYKGVNNSANSLAKLDATSGALDTTFGPAGQNGNGFDADVLAIAVVGKSVYCGGQFNLYRNVNNSANAIAKLDTTNGAIDTTFSPAGALANGFDNDVNVIAPLGTSLFTGGRFTAYRGSSYATSVTILAQASGATQ